MDGKLFSPTSITGKWALCLGREKGGYAQKMLIQAGNFVISGNEAWSVQSDAVQHPVGDGVDGESQYTVVNINLKDPKTVSHTMEVLQCWL